MPPTFEQSKDAIARLVKQFEDSKLKYLDRGHKEAQTRQFLIDPTFVALGWDVHNQQGLPPDESEVFFEDTQEIEGQKKAPDYVFRKDRQRVFFVEAKKPSVDLKGGLGPAYQLRRYAWSAALPLSLLTDFEELAVYDCRIRPSPTDKAAVARVNYFTYPEYPDRWREVWDVFSREAVWIGSFEQYAQAAKARRGTSPVDKEFLKEIEGWRDVLARNMAVRNPRLTIDELNDAVQRTIDRLIFLRMAEDRGIEDYGRLSRLADGDDIYQGLVALFRHADARYNSGLFDFSRASVSGGGGDQLTPGLKADDRVLKPILASLYFPQSPYEFSVLPVEILGNVYEQFLGKVIRLTAAHQAKVEEKPEVKKAGGVYYTPAYIVAYIVKNTVGVAIAGKSPPQLKGFRVLDPACGSGSFLLGAYQCLLDYYLNWYITHEPEVHPKAVWQLAISQPPSAIGQWRLTTAEKKRILLEHIFGVDIDRQAVEVTKLSLLLKVLETESDESLGRQLALFHEEAKERALPNLDRNIKCGNSLIGPDYISGQLMPDDDELKRVNPFDWAKEFPEAMRVGGFDCVIGNPPYVRIGNIDETMRPYLYEKYKVEHRFDIYIVFVMKAFDLLSTAGLLGFILPNKFFTAEYGRSLRNFLIDQGAISSIVDFGDSQVFAGASTYTCLLFLCRQPERSLLYVRAEAGRSMMLIDDRTRITIEHSKLSDSPWIFVNTDQSNLQDRLSKFPLLGSVCHIARGLETGWDDFFFLEIARGHGNRAVVRVASKLEEGEFEIERAIIRPLVKGAVDIHRYFLEPENRYLMFPYHTVGDKIELILEPAVKKEFPFAWRYLTRHSSELKSRKGDLWYAFRRRNYDLRDGINRLLVPSIGQRLAVAYDPDGRHHFVGSGGGGGGGYGLSLRSGIDVSLLFLLGLLNSKLIDWMAKLSNSRFGGGYYSFNRQYIEPLPIYPVNFSDSADKARHDRMVSLVEQMLDLHRRLAAAQDTGERERLQRLIDSSDQQIDALVYDLYGLTPEEIAIVEGKAGQNQTTPP